MDFLDTQIMEKDKFIVTITDISGSKSYSIPNFVKKVAFYVALILTVGVMATAGIIWKLKSDIIVLEAKKANLVTEYEELENHNEILFSSLSENTTELTIVEDRLKFVEDIIGLQTNNELPIVKRADSVSVVATNKVEVLRQVPNGYPIENQGVSASFGYRIHPIKKVREFHNGIDLRAEIGTSAYATADGVVEYVGYEKGGLGKFVIVNHNLGFKTIYGHLSKYKVRSGDVVKKGDLIAETGNTGLSTGPHLHYEVRFVNSPLNPYNFMKWSITNYDVIFTKENKVKWESLLSLNSQNK